MEARPARDRSELEQALALRRQVFQVEQGVERPVGDVRTDASALQLVAADDDHVLGACRVVVEGDVGRLGWMAVERAARGRGAGAAILAAAERAAEAAGVRVMQLYAQRKVESFYASAGYAPCGDPFLAEGIEHISMEKPLA